MTAPTIPQTPDPVLERVARAIGDCEFKLPGAGGLRGRVRIAPGMAVHIARAALSALLPVSEGVAAAIWGAIHDTHNPKDTATAAFEAAIKHIIKGDEHTSS